MTKEIIFIKKTKSINNFVGTKNKTEVNVPFFILILLSLF